MFFKCAPQLVRVQIEVFSESDEYVYLLYVLTTLKECAEDCFFVIVKAVYRCGPLRRFVRQTRSRLYRRQLHSDAELFGQWIDAVTPHTRQVITTWIERRHRLGSQFERFPDNLNIRTSSLEFMKAWLRQ